MSKRNPIIAFPASHTEVAGNVFQVFTIAAIGLFSLVSVLNIAAQFV